MKKKNRSSIFQLAVISMFLMISISCKKNDSLELSTTTLTDITATSVSCGGTVTNLGGTDLLGWGVCWSTNKNPTINDFKTSDTLSKSTFTSSIRGLTPATTYYIKAYATNINGTAYGNELTITTPSTLPSITSSDLSDITTLTAKGGGDITNDGGLAITARGVCWSLAPKPTTADSKTTDGIGPGSFTSSIYTVTNDVTIFIRAYATNSIGTTYGNQVCFFSGIPTVGQSCLGGIAAYILQSDDPGYVAGQTHGLIAGPSDYYTPQWYNGLRTRIVTGTAIGTGNSNTNKIVAIQGIGAYAAYNCYNLVSNGFSDWYLPSNDELNKLYLNRVAIGGFSHMGMNSYWSSSQTSEAFAFSQEFNGGGQGQMYTDNYRYVRSVRSF